MPICIWCKKNKDIIDFGKSNLYKNGKNKRCKECERKRCSVFYHNNLDKNRKRSLEYHWEHREHCLANNRKREEKIRNLIFNHYGRKCECCGETIEQFLSIDHINGGGSRHRRELGSGGRGLYAWIIKNNFPPLFRVLCMNCNFARSKRNNNGICPHQKIKKTQ